MSLGNIRLKKRANTRGSNAASLSAGEAGEMALKGAAAYAVGRTVEAAATASKERWFDTSADTKRRVDDAKEQHGRKQKQEDRAAAHAAVDEAYDS